MEKREEREYDIYFNKQLLFRKEKQISLFDLSARESLSISEIDKKIS